MELGKESRAAIWSQPAAFRAWLDVQADGVRKAQRTLSQARRVYLTGTGTSLHAARLGAWQLREAGLDTLAVSAYDMNHGGPSPSADDALVVFSHRGSKRFSAQTVAVTAAPTVVITGEGSPLGGSAATLYTVPQERSSMHTVSFTAALLAVLRIATELQSDLRSELEQIPAAAEALLASQAMTQAAASVPRSAQLWFAGAGPLGEIAREAALKCKEGAYARAEGFDIEEMLHGPYVALQRGDVVVLVGENDRSDDVRRIAERIGVRVWETPPVTAVHSPVATALLHTVAIQVFALELACLWGVDADGFRNQDVAFLEASKRFGL